MLQDTLLSLQNTQPNTPDLLLHRKAVSSPNCFYENTLTAVVHHSEQKLLVIGVFAHYDEHGHRRRGRGVILKSL